MKDLNQSDYWIGKATNKGGVLVVDIPKGFIDALSAADGDLIVCRQNPTNPAMFSILKVQSNTKDGTNDR